MKKFLFIFIFYAISSVTIPTAFAKSGLVPKYSLTSYCRKISNVSGGSYQIEEVCREQERTAYADIASKNIPNRIWNYCDRIGIISGGSFQLFDVCVEQETGSMGRVR